MTTRRCKNFITCYLDYTDQLEAPTNYHIWAAISIMAACARRKVWIKMGHFLIYPNMYIVLVGPAGKCRKSVSINTAINLVEALNDKMQGSGKDIKISADSITREALIRELSLSMIDDEIGENKYRHASVTIISKELSVFLGEGNIELLSLLTDLFDCPDRWEYKTKNKGIDTITGTWLNILGASTSDWLNNSVPATAIGGGFTSRVIFVVEEDVRKKTPLPVLTDKELQLREDLIHDLEAISASSGAFEFTPEALKWYSSWYMKGEFKIDDPRFWGYGERKHIHLLKISLLIALSEGSPNEITVRHLETAKDMLDIIEPRMVDAFRGSGRSTAAPDFDQIIDLMKRKRVMSAMELQKSILRDVHPNDFEMLMSRLVMLKILTVDVSTGESIYTYNE